MSAHEEVTLHHLLNLLQAVIFGQMPLVDHIQLLTYTQDFLCVYRYIAGLPRVASTDLMYHYPAVWKTESLAGSTSTEQQRTHTCSLSQAYGRDGRADVLHRVINGESSCYGSSWRVDVQADRLLVGVCFQEEQLGNYARGCGVLDFAIQAYDALFQ